MALHVLCPKCHLRYEVADEQAGGTGTCPGCGTIARIPAVGPPAGSPTTSFPPPQYSPHSPYAAPQSPADPRATAYGNAAYGDPAHGCEMAAERFDVHRRLIGIFGVIVAVMGILWAMIYLIEISMVLQGNLPNAPPKQQLGMVVSMCVVFAIASVVTGIVQGLAAICLLGRKRGCRKLGIAAAIVGCASFWECLVWPCSLAYGVYALVILCGRDAIIALEARPAPPQQPRQLPWGDGGPPGAGV